MLKEHQIAFVMAGQRDAKIQVVKIPEPPLSCSSGLGTTPLSEFRLVCLSEDVNEREDDITSVGA